jgi:cell division protein FtsB
MKTFIKSTVLLTFIIGLFSIGLNNAMAEKATIGKKSAKIAVLQENNAEMAETDAMVARMTAIKSNKRDCYVRRTLRVVQDGSVVYNVGLVCY